MNRRAFFKFLPIAPVAFAAEGARAATADVAPYDGQPVIKMTASTPPNRPINDKYTYYPQWNVDTSKSVSMTVGRDGNLWLKTEVGSWKRVVTE